MTVRPRDPLLGVARFVLRAAMAVFILAAAALTILIPVMLVMRDKLLAELAGQGAPPEAIWAIAAILLLAAGAAVLGFYFFRNLYRIVASVGEGDPFVPINAERLRAMGWIVVAVHVLGIPLAAIARWVESVTENSHTDIEMTFSGLLLALILFILARVFRKGTEMRAELEGTV